MNILIIEDDRLLGKKISDIFYDRVITNRIHLISSIEDFFSQYTSIWLYDIILTDLNLWNYKEPEWFMVIKKIREHHSSVPIIVISGYDDVEKLRYAFSLGISDYIVKPVRLRELEVRVAHWFRTHYRMNIKYSSDIISYNELSFDVNRNLFFYNEVEMKISKKNKYILSLFFATPEKILTEKFLCEKIWWDIFFSEKRNIRINIFRLKKELTRYWLGNWIQNIHSEWYVFKKIDYTSV